MREFGAIMVVFGLIGLCLMGVLSLLAGDEEVTFMPAQEMLFLICVGTALFGIACVGYDRYFPSAEEKKRREEKRQRAQRGM